MTTTAEFFDAIGTGDVARVEAFLATEPALASATNESGISAVLWAAYHGQSAVLERLLASGVELTVFEAAAAGDLARLRALLKADPSLARAHSVDGFSALGLAAFFGHPEALSLLLEAGADPNTASRNPMQVTPLHSASAHRIPDVSLRMAESLLGAGASPNVQQQGGWTPLHQAAAHGHVELLELLLAHGADASARSEDGQTAGQKAAEGGHEEIARRLQRQIEIP
jgi:ankyrin repeat protein